MNTPTKLDRLYAAELASVKATAGLLDVASGRNPTLAKRHKAQPGECVYCDGERAAGNDFHPSHDASDRCESGRHSHCSCDTCF